MFWAYLLEWGSLLLRWLHVTTAIAWIGASFFFMHLDASLRKVPDIAKGGASWQVHGGGFYEMRKYLVAPGLLTLGLIRFFQALVADPSVPLIWHPLVLLNHAFDEIGNPALRGHKKSSRRRSGKRSG